jgi:pimeloyl-ACP methyl ester carboxylesterase
VVGVTGVRRLIRHVWPRIARRVPIVTACFNASKPLRHRRYCRPERGEPTLLICLPGIDDVMEDFERHGFCDVRERAPWDVVTVDAHFGYYARRTVRERLRADVIRPARDAGYRRIVVAGISMGGLGALAYAERYPDDVQAVIAMAPYLGATEWQDTASEARGDADLRRLWTWLRSERRASGPPIYLAYGAEDRFAPGHRVLAGLLPAHRVVTAAGGHDWNTWKHLWNGVVKTVADELSDGTRGELHDKR